MLIFFTDWHVFYIQNFWSYFYTHLQVVGGIVEVFILIFFRNRNSNKLQGVTNQLHLWYVCDGIFCFSEANKASVAEQWQGLYKHGYLSKGKNEW